MLEFAQSIDEHPVVSDGTAILFETKNLTEKNSAKFFCDARRPKCKIY